MKYISLLLTGLFSLQAGAQVNIDTLLLRAEKNRLNKLSSISTNNLAELFQAAVDNGIVSVNKADISVKSTLYGIKKLFHPDIALDNKYRHQTALRNFEFSSVFGIDKNNKINEVNPQVKYAFINKRDPSIIDRSDLAAENNLIDAALQNQKIKLAALPALITAAGLNSTERSQVLAILSDYTLLSAPGNPSPLSEVEKLRSLEKNLKNNQQLYAKLNVPGNFFDDLAAASKKVDDYQALIDNKIKRGLLVTVNMLGRYKDIYWDSIAVKFEALKGLGNKKDEDKPWDAYFSAGYNIKPNSQYGDFLARQNLVVKAGLNKILLKNEAGASLLEVLGAAEWRQVLNGLYTGETRTNIIADFTFTFRVGQSMFIPIEIKYDPKNANVFGYFKIKWDLKSAQ